MTWRAASWRPAMPTDEWSFHMPVADEILSIALKLAPVIIEAIISATRNGDVKTLEALKTLLKDPEHIKLADMALMEAQRAKAHERLAPRTTRR